MRQYTWFVFVAALLAVSLDSPSSAALRAHSQLSTVTLIVTPTSKAWWMGGLPHSIDRKRA